MSTVIEQSHPEPTPIPGVTHSTWASAANGLSQISIWRQNLAPGAATPAHSHDCDEVILCLGGWGEIQTEGQVQRFGPNCTVILPKTRLHQIFNAGPLPLEIIGIFGATPVGTLQSDGQVLPLPWSS